MLIAKWECEIWLNFIYSGVRSVILCINSTYAPLTVVVAVIVDGFFVGKFWFFAHFADRACIGPVSSHVIT